jgi:hypothetical protein
LGLLLWHTDGGCASINQFCSTKGCTILAASAGGGFDGELTLPANAGGFRRGDWNGY